MWSRTLDDGTVYHSSMISSDERELTSVEGDSLLKPLADLLLNISTVSSVYTRVGRFY